jgi:hypothetical protein
MAFRMVSREDAKTPEDARAFVASSTGGQVIASGVVREVLHGFEVECFSMDGRFHAPLAAGRQLFQVVAISVDGEFARLKDSYGVPYDVPRTIRGFGSQHFGMGEMVTLEVGQTISAFIVGLDFTEVLVEDGKGAFVDRPQIESVGPSPEAHKVCEAKRNYDAFRKIISEPPEQPTTVVVEPKPETKRDRNEFMNRLLTDLRPREWLK